ncbi:MAG TPA: hypothetical protein VM890_02280 [Longimicrobium sp.]|jgi:hypothetical protein|nr:hypothetical protein [Longimicrobium sp.]
MISSASDPRRLIAAAALVLAPLLLAVADTMQLIPGFEFEFTVVMWISFVLFVPAVLAVAELARGGAPRLALLGGAAALVGTVAGASMQVLFRTRAVLESAALDAATRDAAVGALEKSGPLALSTLVPGILFPLGLLTLGFALYRSRAVPAWSAALVALGGVLFPIGHAVGLAPALIGGDLVLLAGLAPIGAGLLRTARPAVAAVS